MWTWVAVLFLSFLVGLSIGYALKVAFKIFLLLLAFTVVFNAFLWYIGIIVFTANINLSVFSTIWNALRTSNVTSAAKLTLDLVIPVVGFLVGVAYAIKKL